MEVIEAPSFIRINDEPRMWRSLPDRFNAFEVACARDLELDRTIRKSRDPRRVCHRVGRIKA